MYILGWSIPETDSDQVELIRSSVGDSLRRLRRLTVVNRAAGAEYYNRVASLFHVDRSSLRVFNSGFCDFAFHCHD